jgi:glycerate-2-kinase
MVMDGTLREILACALAAADPRAAVRRVLRAEGGDIYVGSRRVQAERVVVLAVGKAASATACFATVSCAAEGRGQRSQDQ